MGMGDRMPYEDAHVAAGAVGCWRKDDDVDRLVVLARAAGLVARADRAYGAAMDALGTRFAQSRPLAVA
jgi:hypothetical protein